MLSDVPEEWSRLPDDDFARRVGELDETLRATAHARRGWKPMYSRVSGSLPLDEIAREGLGVVRAEIEVGTAGRIALAFVDPAGVRLWADDRSIPVTERTEFEMPQGTQRLLFAVDRSRRESPGLRVVIEEAPDSPARARPVNGM